MPGACDEVRWRWRNVPEQGERPSGTNEPRVSYIDDSLLPGEHVVYRAALHPIIFAPATVVIILGIIIALAYSQIIGLVVGVIGVVMGAVALIRYNSSEFAVTNRRVIIKVGALGRRSLEVELNRVEGIDVDQSAFGLSRDCSAARISQARARNVTRIAA